MYLGLYKRNDDIYIEWGTYHTLPQCDDPNALFVEVSSWDPQLNEKGEPVPQVFSADHELVKAAHRATCERLLHAHIYAHYPIPTQNSIQSISMLAVLNDWQDILQETQRIWDWIGQCIAVYRQHASDPAMGLPDFAALVPYDATLKRLSDLEAMVAAKQ